MEASKFREVLSKRNQWVLTALFIVFVVLLVSPSNLVAFSRGIVDFLPIHTALETFSVVISILIFVIAWESKREQNYLNVTVVASGFIAVALIDFAHLLSYPGMPDFVTPANVNKSIFFWLCGRMISALCLFFLVTSRPVKYSTKSFNYVLLFLAFGVSAVIYWIGLGSVEGLPEFYSAAYGLTSLKTNIEFSIVLVLFFSLVILVKKSKKLASTYDVENIIMAIAIMMMGECLLMIYADVTDLYSLMGHIFKAWSYIYFYRALFRNGFQVPYALLNQKNQELEVARVQANAAYAVKSQFLANISHEVRTPMNSIMGMADLLEETKLDEVQARYVGILKNAGEHLLKLVTDVLDLSRIEAGFLELNTEEFDLRKAIEHIEKMMAVTADKKQIQLRFSVDSQIPQKVVGDLIKFNRIVFNLVGNAIKFTDQGSVTVDFKVQSCEEKDIEIFVSVRDTGLGIPEGKIPQLFQSFSQVDSSPTRRHGGTGLGLAISRNLVEAMGGKISVQSEPGFGSVFSFSAKMRLP